MTESRQTRQVNPGFAPIRIGLMLRALDEKGGVGVYTRGITRELLDLDRHNQYILFYRNGENLGLFADRPNVTEQVVSGRFNGLWDQIAMPGAAPMSYCAISTCRAWMASNSCAT